MNNLLLNSLQVRNLLESIHGPKPSPHTSKRPKPSPEESGEWNISIRNLHMTRDKSVSLPYSNLFHWTTIWYVFVSLSLFAPSKAASSQMLDGDLMEKLCELLTQSQVPWKELAEKLGMLTLAHLYQDSPSPCQNLLENYQVQWVTVSDGRSFRQPCGVWVSEDVSLCVVYVFMFVILHSVCV